MTAMKLIKRIRLHAVARDVRGLSTVEYVIILCLIAVIAVGTWRTFGQTVQANINDANTDLTDLSEGGDG